MKPISYPVELLPEEEIPNSEGWAGKLTADQWAEKLEMLFNTRHIVKMTIEIGQLVKIVCFKEKE